MRKLLPMLAVAIAFTGIGLIVKAAEEKTVKGEAQCAKCTLKETKSCQTVVIADEDGKEVKYYLKHNDVEKKFHKTVCPPGTIEEVEATGEVEQEDGKNIMTASKITVVEE